MFKLSTTYEGLVVFVLNVNNLEQTAQDFFSNFACIYIYGYRGMRTCFSATLIKLPNKRVCEFLSRVEELINENKCGEYRLFMG